MCRLVEFTFDDLDVMGAPGSDARLERIRRGEDTLMKGGLMMSTRMSTAILTDLGIVVNGHFDQLLGNWVNGARKIEPPDHVHSVEFL